MPIRCTNATTVKQYFTKENFARAMISVVRWVAKLVARQLAKAALWVRIQISLKNTKLAT
jgi:hypothetical protein